MPKDEAYFEHISDAIESIETYTRNIGREEFFQKENNDDARCGN